MIAIVIVILIVGALFAGNNRKKRKLLFLKKQFGNKPLKETFDFTQTKMYFTECDHKKEHIVDDETWNDLDMDDVFNRLNTTLSFVGEQYLYDRLRTLSYSQEHLTEVERKIQFLQEHEQERIQMQLELMGIGKHQSSYYLPMFFNNMSAFRIGHIWVYWVMQLLLVIGIVSSILIQSQWMIVASGMLFLANICIYASSKNKYEINLEVIAGMYRTLQTMQTMVQKKGVGYTTEFSELKDAVAPLKKALKYFQLILGRNQDASNDLVEMVSTYITGALLLDFTVYDKLLRFMTREKEQFQKVYACAGELDMIITIISFRQSLPNYCTPQFHTTLSLEVEDIFHPLIDEPVCNSVTLKKNNIITGSNASGKSTFMKAVVLNQIFAQTIHTCTAKRMVLPCAVVTTSMAVRDHITEGESYYMREIKSLKRTIDCASGELWSLCAVDEILRGTNARERLAASAAVIKYMQQQNCIIIIATHDLELLELLKCEEYEYYYFSEQPGEGDIVFDYKIRVGISDETNAIKLLSQIGFPQIIVKDAEMFYKNMV